MEPEDDRPEMQDHVPDQVVTARVGELMGEDGPEIRAVGLFAVRFRQQQPRSKQTGQAGCGDFRRLDDTNRLTAAERRGDGAALLDDPGWDLPGPPNDPRHAPDAQPQPQRHHGDSEQPDRQQTGPEARPGHGRFPRSDCRPSARSLCTLRTSRRSGGGGLKAGDLRGPLPQNRKRIRDRHDAFRRSHRDDDRLRVGQAPGDDRRRGREDDDRRETHRGRPPHEHPPARVSFREHPVRHPRQDEQGRPAPRQAVAPRGLRQPQYDRRCVHFRLLPLRGLTSGLWSASRFSLRRSSSLSFSDLMMFSTRVWIEPPQ